MNLHLYVDDERDLPESSEEDLWVLARTYAQAIELLAGWVFQSVSLDHDLGEERTGYDIVCWLERRQISGGHIPVVIKAHSANPVGRANIDRAVRTIERRHINAEQE